MKTIELTQEQWDALQSGETVTITPPPVKWELNQGEWIVGANYVRRCLAHDVPSALNNVWPTKGQAWYAADQQAVWNALMQRWLSLVGDWRPDWDSQTQDKFTPEFWEGEFRAGVYRCLRKPTPFYFPTREQCNQFINDMESYLIEIGV